MGKNRKKYTKQKKQQFPWLLVTLGRILVVIAAMLFTRQNGAGRGTPSIAVDQQRIDYGDVKFGVNKSFAITVANTGDGTLRFKEAPYIEVGEGC